MKYRIGDKVKITDNVSLHGFQVGQEVIIQKIQDKYYYTEKWYFNDKDCKKIDKEVNVKEEEPDYEIY